MCRKGPTPMTGLSVCAGSNQTPNENATSALCMGNESQSRFVNTIPQIGRLRSVVEHVPKMRVAARAMDFSALHQQAEVRTGADVFFGDGRPKAGPAGARIELGVRAEQGSVAADAAKKSVLVELIIRSAERRVGSLLARHIILLGAQLLVPFAVGADHLFDVRGAELLAVVVKLDGGEFFVRIAGRNARVRIAAPAHRKDDDAGQCERRD